MLNFTYVYFSWSSFNFCFALIGIWIFVVGLVWFGLVWCGMIWLGWVCFGVVWLGVVWFGVAWFGMVWFGFIGFVVDLHFYFKKKKSPTLSSTLISVRKILWLDFNILPNLSYYNLLLKHNNVWQNFKKTKENKLHGWGNKRWVNIKPQVFVTLLYKLLLY